MTEKSKKVIGLSLIAFLFSFVILVYLSEFVGAKTRSVNMTVPASVNVVMNEDGSNTISDFYVENNMLIPSQINNISVDGVNGWNLVSKGHKIIKDTKEMTLSIAGHELAGGSNVVSVALPEEKRTDLDVVVTRGAFSNDVKEKAFNLEIGYSLGVKNFTLHFDANGGTSVNSIVAKNGDSVILPTPYKAGYTCEGWKDTSGTIYKTGSSYIMPIGDSTLTAQWKPNTYTIKLHGNGGTLSSGKSDTIQATYDQNVIIPNDVFRKYGKGVLNYNTISDGSGKIYNVGDSIKNLTNENGGVVNLYAQWNSAFDFNSSYHKGHIGTDYSDGENVKSFDYIITKADGSIIKNRATNGDLVYEGIKPGDIVELKFIDYRFGYQFNKFLILYGSDYTSAIGNGVTLLSQDETSIKFRVDKTYSDARSVVSLAWYNEEIPYSLTYNLDGGALSNGVTNPTGYNVRSENITLNNPTKAGYTFKGWEEVIRPTQWHKGDLQNLQGDLNDGGIYESTRGSYYSDFMSVKAGHKYKCNTYGESSSAVIGAKYYDKNFNYVGYLTDVLKTGYTVPQDGYIRFVMPRYEAIKDNILPYAKLTNMTLPKDVTIEKGSVGNREYTAKWTPIQWTVKYDANGGTGSMTDSNHIFNGGIKLNKNTFVRDGYDFSGWNLSRVNNGKTEWLYGNKEGIYVNANQWYEIGKQPNGCVLFNLVDEQRFQVANLINNAVITAHAQWKEKSYNITYNLDGGTLSENAPKTYYSSQGLDKLPIPTKDGYLFKGWKKTQQEMYIQKSPNLKILGTDKVNIKEISDDELLELDNSDILYNTSYYKKYMENEEFYDYYLTQPYLFSFDKTYPLNEDGMYDVTVQWEKMRDTYVNVAPYSYDFKNSNVTRIECYNVDFSNGILELSCPAQNQCYVSIFFGIPKDNSNNYITSIPKGTTGELTLTAEWEKVEVPYNITYNLDGGALPEDSPKTYLSSQGIDKLPIPMKDGYEFKGWTYTDLTEISKTLNNGGPNDIYEVEFLEDVNFNYLIKGMPNPKYIAIYNAHGEQVFYDTTESSKSGVFNIPAGKYKISTFEVKTWNINIEPKKYITSIPKGTIGNINLIANWE